MNQRITSSFNLPAWLIGFVFLLSFSTAQAQANASLMVQSSGFEWKDQATIQQVIQQELTQTNAALSVPNLTDWSQAMLEAYRSLLTFTQAEMPGNHDMQGVLDKAFHQMEIEPVQDPKFRAMVIDDMKAKQVELVQKLTFQ
jgi:hypothetical protein